MKELDNKSFIKVLFDASIISLGVFILFLFGGSYIFEEIFRVNIESFRFFGGVVIFAFAFLYIIKGDKAFIRMKDLKELPADIALPFMVGAGTISLSIFFGERHGFAGGVSVLTIAVILNFILIIVLKSMRDKMPKDIRLVFDRIMDVFLRLNGFFVGSIGVEMIKISIENTYL
jgi:multiple antibiotic resistance protein